MRSSSRVSWSRRSAGCSSAPEHRRSRWARSSRSASARWRRPTGPAARASRSERPCYEDADMSAPGQRPRRRGPAPRNSGPPRGRSGPARPPEVDPARQAALELLTAVRVRAAYANLALPAILRRYRLSGRDAAFATELGYGTLRAQGLLDGVLEACVDRDYDKVETALKDAMRLGAYQLLRTRVPAHAAVHGVVELVRIEAGSRS